mmetsp:Transcript_8262/g.9613  ORF Transcript_8262/g.9613 Transcript_8262/m.9613 type:complete len:382 (+) Transcript_8262:23-1168(+)
MFSSPRSPPTATATTQLPWTVDDDEKFSSGWNDSYDVDKDLGSLDDEENKKQDDPLIFLNSDGEDNGDVDETIHDDSTKPTPTFTPITLTNHPISSDSNIDSIGGGEGVKYSMSNIESINDKAPDTMLSTISPYRVATPVVKLNDGEENFEEIMRKRNCVRKERENYHIAHIKVQLSRLEDALASETKRRVDATTALDELARNQVHEMEERIRGQLQQENDKLQCRLGALEERVQMLEQNWTYDSNNQIELVQSKSTDLGKSISQIREDQDMECKARLKREGILLQQVEGKSNEFEDRWTSERNDRIQRLEELEDQIVCNEARLALEQKKYEERIETELATLKEELEIEAVERQAQDEEIVAALNRYTQQLQHSLSILSSD